MKNQTVASRLIQDFPSLFPKDKAGNAIPPVGGAHFPEEWFDVIYVLCARIKSYMDNYYELKINVLNPVRYYFIFSLTTIIEEFQRILVKYVINDSRVNKHFNTVYAYLSRKNLNNFKLERCKLPPVVIDQIKTKFNELRFYYSGGDSNIRQFISFANFMIESKFLNVKKV